MAEQIEEESPIAKLIKKDYQDLIGKLLFDLMDKKLSLEEHEPCIMGFNKDQRISELHHTIEMIKKYYQK